MIYLLFNPLAEANGNEFYLTINTFYHFKQLLTLLLTNNHQTLLISALQFLKHAETFIDTLFPHSHCMLVEIARQ
jgi:hypothetical protein